MMGRFRIAVIAVFWITRWLVTCALIMLLAVGLSNVVHGLFQFVEYYWLSEGARRFPVKSVQLFLGLKLIAVYTLTIWLFSQYQFSSANRLIVKRSMIGGLVIGSLFIGAIAIERFLAYYYPNIIDCELPGFVIGPK